MVLTWAGESAAFIALGSAPAGSYAFENLCRDRQQRMTSDIDQSMLWEIWSIAGWDMSGFETWLADTTVWEGNEDRRKHLQELRQELVDVYRTYYDADSDRIAQQAKLLRAEATVIAAILRNERLELRDRHRREQPKAAAMQRRPNAASPIKKKVLEAMRPSKREGRPFKDFIRSWENNPINSLSAEVIGDGRKYRIFDEESSMSTEYSLATLESMYSRSDD